MNRRRGFTLIEVLVALAVLAIALGAAFRGASQATDGQALLKQRTLALWIAQNRLASEQLDAASIALGRREGVAQQAGTAFVWRETIATTPNPSLLRIDVSVGDAGNPEYALAQLTGYLSRATN
jgi:general secretion pathway protein I